MAAPTFSIEEVSDGVLEEHRGLTKAQALWIVFETRHEVQERLEDALTKQRT